MPSLPRDVCSDHDDQLLGLRRQRAFGEDALTEACEDVANPGRQAG
jgi:hypothetical protein